MEVLPFTNTAICVRKNSTNVAVSYGRLLHFWEHAYVQGLNLLTLTHKPKDVRENITKKTYWSFIKTVIGDEFGKFPEKGGYV